VANVPPLTPELVVRIGEAAGRHLAGRVAGTGRRPAVLVARDTRLSGPLLEQAFVAGVLSAGVDALVAGVLPTPAVALLIPPLGAAGGAVISASHNPFEDNGIKLFGADGGKLPDADEDAIEAALSGEMGPRPTGAGVGRLMPVAGAERRYIAAVRGSVPAEFDLTGVKLVLDCAHGATCRVAPRLFKSLGAEVVLIGGRPTGTNINRGVGALHPQTLQARVRSAGGPTLGLAFDGDGDRLIVVDETGAVRDGDHVLAVCARALAARGDLRGGAVVSTVMANLGLERALAAIGVGLMRAPVGDRYVLEAMREHGANLGGEQSGHIIFLDHAPTGDALVAALQLLRVVRESESPLHVLADVVVKHPQVLVNVPVRAKPVLAGLTPVADVVTKWERALNGRARILLRYSGTEPLARVMVEGDDRMLIEDAAHDIAAALSAAIGGPA
jgi:phosphoglucosamine mutase